MATTLTRKTVALPDGTVDVAETEAKSSVEIGETASGHLKIQSVKVYANDEIEAVRRTVAAYDMLRSMLRDAPAEDPPDEEAAPTPAETNGTRA